MTSETILALMIGIGVGCTSVPSAPVPPAQTSVLAIPTTGLPTPTATSTVAPTARIVATNTATSTEPRPGSTRALSEPSATSSTSSNWRTTSLLVGPGQPNRLYAFQYDYASPGILAGHTRLLISDDAGSTWMPFPGGLPSGEARCLHDLNLDYAIRDSLYASTCHGLEHWSGSKWETISPKETVHVAIAYGDPKSLWAIMTTSPGLISRSNDGGTNWIPADGGTSVYGSINALSIDPRGGKMLYAIREANCCGRALIRGTLAGEWIDMPLPIKSVARLPFVTGVAIDGATGALYVSASDADSRGQIWKSANPTESDVNRVTWTMLHDFGAHWDAYLLSSGPRPNGVALYAIVQNYPAPPTVERSLDGGQTWMALKIP